MVLLRPLRCFHVRIDGASDRLEEVPTTLDANRTESSPPEIIGKTSRRRWIGQPLEEMRLPIRRARPLSVHAFTYELLQPTAHQCGSPSWNRTPISPARSIIPRIS